LHILFFSWIKTHGDLCLWNCEFSTHYLVELLPVFIFFCIHYLMFIFQIIFLWLMVHVRASLENRRIITLSLSTCDQGLVRIYFIWYLDMGFGVSPSVHFCACRVACPFMFFPLFWLQADFTGICFVISIFL
jgi:hypothetical protein